MMRFPITDILLFALMLAVARWGDGLPLALLSVAQWAVGLDVISAVIIYALGLAGLLVTERRGLLMGLLIGFCTLLLVVFFGVILSGEFHVLLLLVLALMLMTPITLAIRRADLPAITALRIRALVVLGALVGIFFGLGYLPFEPDFPMSPESRAALGYEPDDDYALHASVVFGTYFYGILSAVELVRWLWWRLTLRWN